MDLKPLPIHRKKAALSHHGHSRGGQAQPAEDFVRGAIDA